MIRRFGLWVVLFLCSLTFTLAQDESYPLTFQYDSQEDLFWVEAEITVRAGDTLEALIENGESLYFWIYTETEDLYEGASLDGFVADADGTLFVEVVSLSEASGELTVISGGVSLPARERRGGEAGTFEEIDCPFDVPANEDVTCGVLIVPENRQTNNGATVELMVAILHAYTDSPQPDPIIYLEGGPGGSALAFIDTWYDNPYREKRDFILFDQRGTGFSLPSLNCPEMDNDEAENALIQCRDRLLSEGVDLTAYNSRENAADVEALRRALGYERVNLYGISYGTRLALTVMRDYPDSLRAVVLDSVYPPNVDTSYLFPSDTYTLISTMFDDCAAQPACNAAFPDLEARFYAALDAIVNTPPLVTNYDGDDVELYAKDVLNTLVDQLKTNGLVSAIPAALNAFIEGDYETYFLLANEGAGDDSAQDEAFDENSLEIDDDSEGMNLSVQCREEILFANLDEATTRARSVGMPDLLLETLFATVTLEFEECALWPAGEPEPIENQAVVSDIPTLVLSAQYDTATPPSWGDIAAETLSNSYNFHLPLIGHSVIDGGECPLSIALLFIDSPNDAPDTSCIASMNTAFYIP